MTRTITRAEVAEHNSRKSTWFVISNKVYDVSKFLDEHPGGCEVLLEQAGKDGTEAFLDVGHSTDARNMKEEYLVGNIVEAEHMVYSNDKKEWSSKPGDNLQRTDNNPAWVMPALVAVIIALFYYIFSS